MLLAGRTNRSPKINLHRQTYCTNMVPRNFPTLKLTKFSEIDIIVEHFRSHPREYDSTVESWMEDILQESYLSEYYQRRMKRAIDSFIAITNHCYMLGKEAKVYAKIVKLRNVKDRLEGILKLKQNENNTSISKPKYHILKLHQPVASLVVYGLIKTIKCDGLPNLYEGDVVFVFAEEATKNSLRGLWANESVYGTYHNALVMGAVEEYDEMPKGCYIGFVKVGQRTKEGFYITKESFVFDTQVKELTKGINTAQHTKLNKPKISFENGKLRVPLNNELWKQMESAKGHFYLYWKREFDYFFSSIYGLGNDGGLYDIIFVHGNEEKRYKQDVVEAVSKQEYVSSSDERPFWALVVNFEKLSLKKKYEDSSFSILRKQEWILDWKCVKFKNGYFVVVPPVDDSVKFKPQAISKPGVIESYNYLKEYLNDRLAPVRCSVEELKLTIYDTIRLDEAIAKFASVSKQRAIKTTGKSNVVRIAPHQMSFKQALSKASQMTPEEFEKYKSDYINFLVGLQSENYKVIPCVERLAHSNSDITEYAFLFSIMCSSGKILIVHENVNPDRATLLFLVKEENFKKSIREIYDFLQSAEINKRSSLRGKNIEIEDAGILIYRSINHDDLYSWKQTINSYKRYR